MRWHLGPSRCRAGTECSARQAAARRRGRTWWTRSNRWRRRRRRGRTRPTRERWWTCARCLSVSLKGPRFVVVDVRQSRRQVWWAGVDLNGNVSTSQRISWNGQVDRAFSVVARSPLKLDSAVRGVPAFRRGSNMVEPRTRRVANW